MTPTAPPGAANAAVMQLPNSPPATGQRQLYKKHVVSTARRDRRIRNPQARREQELRTLQIAARQRDITGPAFTFEDLNARYHAIRDGQLPAANRDGPYSSHFYELVGRGGALPRPVMRQRMYMHPDVRACGHLEQLLKDMRLRIGHIYRITKEPRPADSTPKVESSVHERGLAMQQPHLDVVITAYGRELIFLYGKFVRRDAAEATTFAVDSGHMGFAERVAFQRASFQSVQEWADRTVVGIRDRPMFRSTVPRKTTN